MTAPDPRLGEIEALAEGLTDLCPTYLRQIIRHAQRNCDIECNEHDGDDACNQPDRYDGARMAEALCSIPYLLAELRKAQDALAKVDALTREWEAIGKGNTQFDSALRVCAYKARAAVAAAIGGGA